MVRDGVPPIKETMFLFLGFTISGWKFLILRDSWVPPAAPLLSPNRWQGGICELHTHCHYLPGTFTKTPQMPVILTLGRSHQVKKLRLGGWELDISLGYFVLSTEARSVGQSPAVGQGHQGLLLGGHEVYQDMAGTSISGKMPVGPS